jgi:peptidoglycan/xylan/chitin deacetylase (PgdA/CDA1 family)
VALTFDDGPHPETTPRLLDLLRARNLRATFFLIGRECAAFPELLVRERAEGHELGNHTWTHPHLTRLETAEQINELERTSGIIEQVAGERPVLMRPPYLDINEGLEQLVGERFRMKVIGASIYSNDTGETDPNRIAENIFAGLAPGGVILCHDNRPATIQAMPAVLDTIVERGFQLVTVSELIAMESALNP